MGLKALKAVLYTLLSLALLLGLTGVVAYWRLHQGPVALGFLQSTILEAVNRQLPGYAVSFSDTVLELDPQTRVPSLQASKVVLRDGAGQVLATAPRIGVTLDRSEALWGRVVVTSVELMGSKINARRNLDGSVELGFGETAAGEDEVVVVNEGEFEGQAEAPDTAPATTSSGSRILNALGRKGEGAVLSGLAEIRVRSAALTVFDEANGASWKSPSADLVFRRMDYGFLVVANALVASGGEPWRAELSAAYKRETDNYALSISVTDLVPANVADEIYALSQFARLSMPFSGRLDMELSADGTIRKAEGALLAAAGELNFPDYFARPLQVEKGDFKLSYDVTRDIIELTDSSLLVGGVNADISGTITPQRLEDGRLVAYQIDMTATNAATTADAPLQIDRITFKGAAALDSRRVQIDDLVIMAGETGVRMRGAIAGGEDSAGIQVAGRLRDVSSDLLKLLWPPILAPNTRSWINEHVSKGRITEGTFQVNFPVNMLAKSLREKRLPDGAVDVSFQMDGVTTTYFKSMPPLTGAAGSARIRDSRFEMNMNQGQAQLESGARISLSKGTFVAEPLMQDEVPGDFKFDVEGPVASMLAFASHPDLDMAPPAESETPKLRGTAKAKISLNLPLIKDVPKSRVSVKTEIAIVNAEMAAAMPGVDLTGGQFSVAVGETDITVSGPAKLNGTASKILWKKPLGKGEAEISVETVADAALRNKLGLKIEDYVDGDIPVKVRIGPPEEKGRLLEVEADLSDVAMRLQAAGWSRKPVKGTTATFTVLDQGKGNRRIENIKIDGRNLRLRGSVTVKGGEVATIKATEIKLEEDDIFTATLSPGDGVMNLEVSGTSLDARPYIKQLVSPSEGAAPGTDPPKGQNFVVTARFDKVYAYRGEQIRDVKATFVTKRGSITTANIEGLFASGKPLTIRLTPSEAGRELRVASIDGGAVLRATDYYGKVAGGELQFYAFIENKPGGPIRNGSLEIERFEVRNEAALAELDARGRPKKSGPRRDGIFFRKLTMPFNADNKYVRLCKVLLRGPDMGATASGIIRKKDGAMDVTGTFIPVYGLNSFVGEIPLLGEILTGGNREGILGITYAMGGTITKPDYQLNPLSFLAPGILRKLFEYEQTACGTAPRKQQNQSNNN